jgi:hypothetical protein
MGAERERLDGHSVPVGAERERLEDLARRAETAPPLEALEALRTIRGRLDALEAEHVDRAVGDGGSWRAVADALGISKQAAHKRHARRRPARGGPRPDEAPVPVRGGPRAGAGPNGTAPPAGGRVLVTSEARQAVRLGREEAARCGSEQVGTEHLLLGILRCDYCIAIQALRHVGVTLEAARAALAPTLAAGARPSGGEVISEAARDALEQSLREAVARGEGYLGVEHLLMALLHDPASGAVRTLAEMDIDTSELLRELDRTAEQALHFVK